MRSKWCPSPNAALQRRAVCDTSAARACYGEWRQESAEAKAERIVPAELKRWGGKEKDLPVRRQSDPEKLAMAARLRTETILAIPRIVVRLHRGSAKSAKAKLALRMKAHTRQSAQPPAETGIFDRKLEFDPVDTFLDFIRRLGRHAVTPSSDEKMLARISRSSNSNSR